MVPLSVFLATAPISIPDSGPKITYDISGLHKVTADGKTLSVPLSKQPNLVVAGEGDKEVEVNLEARASITIDWRGVPEIKRTRCFLFKMGAETSSRNLKKEYFGIWTFADKDWQSPKEAESTIWSHEVMTPDTSDLQKIDLNFKCRAGGSAKFEGIKNSARSEIGVVFELAPVRIGSAREKLIQNGIIDFYDAGIGKLVEGNPQKRFDTPAYSNISLRYPSKGYRITPEQSAELESQFLTLKLRMTPGGLLGRLTKKNLRRFDDDSMEKLGTFAFGNHWRKAHNSLNTAWINIRDSRTSYWFYPTNAFGQPFHHPAWYTLPYPTGADNIKELAKLDIGRAGRPLPVIKSDFNYGRSKSPYNFVGQFDLIQCYGGFTITHHQATIEIRSEEGRLLREAVVKWRGNVENNYRKDAGVNFGYENFTIDFLGPDYDGGPLQIFGEM